jgi:NAD(P)-dependent dehydrogenase (short-subunit alcohol dehydrogenase family)
MRLASKVVIISGSASGMGAATASMFARQGAKVVVGDVLEHEGREVAKGIGARFERLDVTKEESGPSPVSDPPYACQCPCSAVIIISPNA